VVAAAAAVAAVAAQLRVCAEPHRARAREREVLDRLGAAPPLVVARVARPLRRLAVRSRQQRPVPFRRLRRQQPHNVVDERLSRRVRLGVPRRRRPRGRRHLLLRARRAVARLPPLGRLLAVACVRRLLRPRARPPRRLVRARVARRARLERLACGRGGGALLALGRVPLELLARRGRGRGARARESFLLLLRRAHVVDCRRRLPRRRRLDLHGLELVLHLEDHREVGDRVGRLVLGTPWRRRLAPQATSAQQDHVVRVGQRPVEQLRHRLQRGQRHPVVVVVAQLALCHHDHGAKQLIRVHLRLLERTDSVLRDAVERKGRRRGDQRVAVLDARQQRPVPLERRRFRLRLMVLLRPQRRRPGAAARQHGDGMDFS